MVQFQQGEGSINGDKISRQKNSQTQKRNTFPKHKRETHVGHKKYMFFFPRFKKENFTWAIFGVSGVESRCGAMRTGRTIFPPVVTVSGSVSVPRAEVGVELAPEVGRAGVVMLGAGRSGGGGRETCGIINFIATQKHIPVSTNSYPV